MASRNKRSRKGKKSQHPTSPFAVDGKSPRQLRREAESRKDNLRKDCVSFVKVVCNELTPDGWKFDPDMDRGKQGWYGDKCDFFDVTPEDAEALFLFHNWSGQRRLRDNHAIDLAQNVREVLDISFAIGPDNKPWVINGQHNLWGIVLSQETKRAKITVYQCRDAASIAECYTAFDSPGGVRNEKEIIEAHMKAGSINTSVSAQRFKKWVADGRAAKNGFTRSGLSRTNTSRMHTANDPEIIAFAEFMEGILVRENITWTTIRQLVPQGVGAAFFCMATSDPTRARKFVTSYLLGVNLTKEHPCYVLRERIMNKPKGFHADTMIGKHAGMTWVCWRKFCINAKVLLLKTVKLAMMPRYNAWKLAGAVEMHQIDAPGTVETVGRAVSVVGGKAVLTNKNIV